MLKGMTRSWFGILLLDSVENFNELAKIFVTQFLANKKRKHMTMYLLTMKHHKEESLKVYLVYFNTERLTTHDQNETINLAILLGGIWLENPILK